MTHGAKFSVRRARLI